MSCNNCNNCDQCNPAPSIQLTPPPTCPTNACEEYISSDCVVNTVSGSCGSQFYQHGTGGDLILVNGAPVPQDPPIPLGITVTPNEPLTNIISDLVDSANCMFNPDYIAGMLQVIQANPTHPVSQIFCNLACSCNCDDGCPIEIVDTVTFPENLITDTSFVLKFFGLRNYIYVIEVVDTNATTPTVYHYEYPTAPITVIPSGLVTFSSNSLLDSSDNPITGLPSGHTYEVTITSKFNNQSCTSESFTTYTTEATSCDCKTNVVLNLTYEAASTGSIELVIDVTTPVGYLPQAYNIEVFDPLNNVVFGPADYDPTLYLAPPPANRTQISIGGGLLAGGDYLVRVIPICTITPSLRCAGDLFTITIPVSAPAVCAPPDITSVTIA